MGKAVRDFKLTLKNAEEGFLTRGYNNWKAATDAFCKHESSDCHAQSVEKMYTLPSTTKDFLYSPRSGKASESSVLVENFFCPSFFVHAVL